MNILESILNFILSFLKLSTNKILIGLLSIGLGGSLWFNKVLLDRIDTNQKASQVQIDTLRSTILNNAIKTSEREIRIERERNAKDLELYKRLDELTKK
jgi:hypothetical protein